MLHGLMSYIFTQFDESFLCFEMENLLSIAIIETSKRNDDNMKISKTKNGMEKSGYAVMM